MVTTNKGEVTSAFIYDNCAEIDMINNSPSNFCQIANIGESYLAVIGDDGEVTLAQE